MKKITLSILAALLGVSMISCSSVKAPEATEEPSQVESVAESTVSETESAPESEAEDPVVKEDGEVTITIPAQLLLEGDSAELSEEGIEHGFVSCVMNDDGSLTYTIDEENFNEYLKTMKSSIEETMKTMIDGDDCPSVVDIVANEEWRDFEVSVNEEAYMQSSDRDAIASFAVDVARYHLFSGTPIDELSVTVYIQNSETNAVLDVIWFPNENESLENTVG